MEGLLFFAGAFSSSCCCFSSLLAATVRESVPSLAATRTAGDEEEEEEATRPSQALSGVSGDEAEADSEAWLELGGAEQAGNSGEETSTAPASLLPLLPLLETPA